MKAIERVIFIVEKIILKNAINSHLKWSHSPRAMTHGNKIWVQMKHKYYSTFIEINHKVILINISR
jgi:hypothetical protein